MVPHVTDTGVEPDGREIKVPRGAVRGSARRWRLGLAVGALGGAALVLIMVQQAQLFRTAVAEEAAIIATEFLEAREAWDEDRVLSYLDPDAVVSINPARKVSDIPAELSWLRATQWRYHVDGCSPTSFRSEGTHRVMCAVTYENAWSRVQNLAPDSSSRFTIEVRDGLIVSAMLSFAPRGFGAQSYAAFAEWVRDTHPEDAAVMFVYDTAPVLTEASIQLWEQYTQEYVQEVGG